MQRVEVESGKPLDVRAKLTPIPARLRIEAEPRDAQIMVDQGQGWVFKGTAFESFAQPILIPLPEGQSSKSVRVRFYADGYADKTETLQVTANQNKNLHVKLSHQ
jgi:hypothetical protein